MTYTTIEAELNNLKPGEVSDSDVCSDFKYRKSRCHDCGFTKGTAANLNGVTDIKATLCAEIPEPFYCHFNVNGNEIGDGKEVLCQGWVEACNILNALGHYEKQPKWQQEYKMKLVEAISEIEQKQLNGYEGIELINRAMGIL